MKKLVVSFIAGVAGILIARYFIAGFTIPDDYLIIAQMALVLAAINISVRPLLTFIFKPFIILTLGLLYFVIAALLLWFVDYFMDSISFTSFIDLFYTAVILSITNSVFNAFIK